MEKNKNDGKKSDDFDDSLNFNVRTSDRHSHSKIETNP